MAGIVLPEAARGLLESDAVAHVVTIDEDGGPQVTAAWLGLEGDEIVLATMWDQRKLRNLRRDPRIVLSVERQPLLPIVEDALQAFEPLRLTHAVELQRQLAADLPQVVADREALSGALLDLLFNAHKYTGPDKRITVSAARAGPAVVIAVADNGPGISVSDQKRIFDKFYRGADPLSRAVEGTGLGLAMVKHIVAAHGGKVSVASEVVKVFMSFASRSFWIVISLISRAVSQETTRPARICPSSIRG